MEACSRKYEQLNRLADPNGIVIFGGRRDLDLPVGELRQAFSVESKIYNRSFPELTAENAAELYGRWVAPLAPETLLLRLGEADLESYGQQPDRFDRGFRQLVARIRAENRDCRIVVVSLTEGEDPRTPEMNRHLKDLAASERCEFGDIGCRRVKNPRNARALSDFLYSSGFVHQLNRPRPVQDLVQTLFSCIA